MNSQKFACWGFSEVGQEFIGDSSLRSRVPQNLTVHQKVGYQDGPPGSSQSNTRGTVYVECIAPYQSEHNLPKERK